MAKKNLKVILRGTRQMPQKYIGWTCQGLSVLEIMPAEPEISPDLDAGASDGPRDGRNRAYHTQNIGNAGLGARGGP